MTTFTLTIELGNEAMDDANDITDALRDVADDLELYGYRGNVVRTIRDENGNTVGRWELNA